jgi:hypothetical protein
MKAEHVIVIAVNTGYLPEEIYGGAVALTNRYGAYYIDVDTPVALPSASQWQNYIETHGRLKIDRAYVDMISGESKDVGVYVVAHGGGGMVAMLTGDQWALFIKELGFKNIRKLCIVSCNSASTSAKVQTCFIEKLCEALCPLTPMVAGWDGFVTVAEPGMPGPIHNSLNANNPRTAEYYSESESNQIKFNAQKLAKKKVIAPIATASPQLKDKLKVVYQWRDGNLVTVPLTEWSDKS